MFVFLNKNLKKREVILTNYPMDLLIYHKIHEGDDWETFIDSFKRIGGYHIKDLREED